MGRQLGADELALVFSFLGARDLLCAAQVNKAWSEVSRTSELWRLSVCCCGTKTRHSASAVSHHLVSVRPLCAEALQSLTHRQLCLRRWSSCKASQMVLGTQTWKQYYLCRSELEFRVESGRPGKDFTCKAIAGHTGQIDKLAYISTNEYRFDGRAKSVVCTVSSDCTVRAWDLNEGVEIWCSPLQPAPLVNVVPYPQRQLVATVDEQGLIKVWKAETGQECASFCLPSSPPAVEACDRQEGALLLVACAEGNLCTLTVPQLQVVSSVTLFPNIPVSLFCSPDRQWAFASPQDSDLNPKVFYTPSLQCPPDAEPPASTTLPIHLSSRACWVPDKAARLAVMHRDANGVQLVVTTFELRASKSRDRVDVQAQQVASFPLPDTMMPPHLMQGHSSQVILLASSSELVLFTTHGLQLAAFQDHQKPITSLWVDPDRVITSSFDLSLRVYVWNKENKIPVLKSCYHLHGGSHRWGRGFTHVESDSMSIVGVEVRSTGGGILRSYCFRVQRGEKDYTREEDLCCSENRMPI